MTLDDLTSGFNIGTNYSLSYGFNEMVVFFNPSLIIKIFLVNFIVLL